MIVASLRSIRGTYVGVCWLLLILNSTACSGGQQVATELNAAKLYDDHQIAEIDIQLAPQDWEKMRFQKRDFAQSMVDPNAKPFDYVQADITINGMKIPKVGIRKKGFIGSLDDDFPSMRVKFDEFGGSCPIQGLDRLTLNNNKQDPSLVSQHMTYRFFNLAKVQAPRVGFAKVTVNGTYLGVYSNVESVAGPFLQDRFGDESGELLEGTISDFSAKTLDRFDLKSGKNKSPADWKVMKLSELLADKDKSTLESIGQLVDLESFYRFWAVESLLGFWDGYASNQNNYFVYDNPKDGKLYFMPWGADSVWMGTAGPFGGFGPQPPTSIYANSMLAHRLYQAEGGAERYRTTMMSLVEELWNEESLYAEIKRVGDLLEPHLHDRQKSMRSSQKAMQRFIQTRKKKVLKELENWPVKIADHPRRPMYAVQTGEASGSFETFWERVPKGESTQATVQLVVEGQPVELSDVKVIAKPFQFGGFGMGMGGNFVPPVLIEMTGKRVSDDANITLSLSIDHMVFEQAAGKSVESGGSFIEGDAPNGFAFFGAPNMRWVQGTLDAKEVNLERGKKISGSFKVKLMHLKGGFMDQRPQ